MKISKKDRLAIIGILLEPVVSWLIAWLFVGALIATFNITSGWWWLGVAIVIIAFFNCDRCCRKRTALIKKKRDDKS